MKVIVGLGNPGSQYESTRHNLGFLVVQHLAQTLEVKFASSRCCKGLEAAVQMENEEIKLLLPMVFMNLSGKAVKPFMMHYDIALEDMLVVYDDFHLAFGQLRLRRKGSDGGHNGLSSLIEVLGVQEFSRLRLGIGEPKGKQDTEGFVLSEFNNEEKKELDFFIQDAVHCCRAWVSDEIEQVMSQFNKRKGDG